MILNYKFGFEPFTFSLLIFQPNSASTINGAGSSSSNTSPSNSLTSVISRIASGNPSEEEPATKRAKPLVPTTGSEND